ncbi:hypothetical protein GN956_G26596, partial [Arapaima gigas]
MHRPVARERGEDLRDPDGNEFQEAGLWILGGTVHDDPRAQPDRAENSEEQGQSPVQQPRPMAVQGHCGHELERQPT